jgi:hypothetical protein
MRVGFPARALWFLHVFDAILRLHRSFGYFGMFVSSTRSKSVLNVFTDSSGHRRLRELQTDKDCIFS